MIKLSHPTQRPGVISLFIALLASFLVSLTSCQTSGIRTKQPENGNIPLSPLPTEKSAQLDERAQKEFPTALRIKPPLLNDSRLRLSTDKRLFEQTLLNELKIPAEQVGYVLYDPEQRIVLSQHQLTQVFIPASVSKVMSTVAALKILGPRYRFKTELLMTGKIHQHTLHGDLYLRGTGDPLLTVSGLMQLTHRLKEKGITKVKGNFYYDDTFLTHERAIDPVRDEDERYNTGISSLSSEFNQLALYWKRSVEDPETLEVHSLPQYSLLEMKLKAPTEILKENRVQLDPEDQSLQGKLEESWYLDPKLATIGSKMVPVRDPSAFTAEFFRILADLEGIELNLPKTKKAPKNARFIASKTSLPLTELAEKILEYSNNTMTELIQLAAVRKLSGKPLSIKESAGRISQWLKKTVPQADWDSFAMGNASGLGPANRISPEQLMRVLEYAGHSHFIRGQSYSSLLPISGFKGSLARRLQHPEASPSLFKKN